MRAWVFAALFASGLVLWPLVEYVIHGVLAHRMRTPVTPLHWGHHRDPASVFTSPLGWIPGALGLLVLLALPLGWGPAGAIMAGVVAGFAHYEYVHWRIHFREPRSARERLLRSHHLAHHYCDAKSYHGVTTRFWDRVFGTLPDHAEADYARAAKRPPLAGRSNLRRMYDVRTGFGLFSR